MPPYLQTWHSYCWRCSFCTVPISFSRCQQAMRERHSSNNFHRGRTTASTEHKLCRHTIHHLLDPAPQLIIPGRDEVVKTYSFSQWEKHTMKTRRSNCRGTSDASWRTTGKSYYFLAALWKHIQNNINWSRTLLEICEFLVQPSLLWNLIGTGMVWGVKPQSLRGRNK